MSPSLSEAIHPETTPQELENTKPLESCASDQVNYFKDVTRSCSKSSSPETEYVHIPSLEADFWIFPSSRPVTPTPQLAAGPREDSIALKALKGFKTFVNVLSDTALILVGVVLLAILVYQRTASLVNKPSEEINESDERCYQQLPSTHAGNTNRLKQCKCVLPPYPEHGIYIISSAQALTPGKSFQSLKLTVICLPDYGVLETATVLCVDGTWSNSIPSCVRFCKLNSNPSVHYHCLVSGSITGQRACNSYEPSGTAVRPECNSPNYYSAATLPFMRCVNGYWNYVADCLPECGRVTADGVSLIIDGRPAKRGELPWHVGIYRKITRPYLQICGGNIVTNRVVISAAHCFCNPEGRQQPAFMYAVAAGKIYRPWNNTRDVDVQKSDVKAIYIPARYQGVAANFQDDIAMLVLVTPFVYNTFIRPVCLDFDANFNARQLQSGNLGKVAGWGLTSKNGNSSQILKVVKLPYVDIEQCITASPPAFRGYITSDKICAGYGNGTTLCRGDSGGGLAFLESERGTYRYYLRGIVSTAPNDENSCNSRTLIAFTQILLHEHFILEHL